MANGSTTVKLGKNATISRNTGTYGSPTWVEITNVGDLELTGDKIAEEVTVRGDGGFVLEAGTLKQVGVAFDMRHDPADDCWTALHASFLSNTSIEILVLNGPSATAGSQGFRMTVECFKFAKKQGLKGAQRDDVELRPTVSANPPAWYTAS